MAYFPTLSWVHKFTPCSGAAPPPARPLFSLVMPADSTFRSNYQSYNQSPKPMKSWREVTFIYSAIFDRHLMKHECCLAIIFSYVVAVFQPSQTSRVALTNDPHYQTDCWTNCWRHSDVIWKYSCGDVSQNEKYRRIQFSSDQFDMQKTVIS